MLLLVNLFLIQLQFQVPYVLDSQLRVLLLQPHLILQQDLAGRDLMGLVRLRKILLFRQQHWLMQVLIFLQVLFLGIME